MRIKPVCSLPSRWSAPGLLLESDIKVTRCGRLRLKLLVFDSNKSLRAFWAKNFKPGFLCKKTLGCVNRLQTHIISFKGGRETQRLEVDKRYFAVMGLLKDHLKLEIITHEAVHAGCAYLDRVKKRVDWPGQSDNEEEGLAYPVGRIARGVVSALGHMLP